MKEALYTWMKNLAVFYILLTSLLHLAPEEKYGKYIRFFMGLLLILMMITPGFVLLGKGDALLESFRVNFNEEDMQRSREEMENLQEIYLEMGCEVQMKNKILESLKNRGIEPAQVEVNIEGEKIQAVIYLRSTWGEEEEGRIADGLKEACGLGQGEYQIKTFKYDSPAVDGAASSGGTAGGDGASGVG